MDYQLIVGQLYKAGVNGILRRCILEHERKVILYESHEGVMGWNYVAKETMKNVLHA